MASSTKLSTDQVRFVAGVSSQTKIDPRVIIAWMVSEGATAPNGTGHFNYLNLRPLAGDRYQSVSTGNFEQFATVDDSIKATVRRLNQPFAKPIIATAQAKPTPAQQIAAIASTNWDSAHYGGRGGPRLISIFTSLFKNANDSYLDPGNASGVASTIGTGSATIGKDPIGSTPSVIGAAAGAANDAARHIPGVAQVEDVGGAIKWLFSNWDRVGIILLGVLVLTLGLVFAFKKQTGVTPGAAAAGKAFGKKG